MQNEPNNSTIAMRWEVVRECRMEFAEELFLLSSTLTNDDRRHVRAIVRWLKGDAYLDDALGRPDVLAMCLPLIESVGDSAPDRTQLASCARSGFCELSRCGLNSKKLIKKLIYPILVMFAACLMLIGFSFWIAPEFEQVFQEFGIGLPSITLLVLDTAKFIRTWWLAFPMVVLATASFWYFNRAGSLKRPANLTWLDQELMGNRTAVAAWGWHLSLLLDAGLNELDALRVAGSTTAKTWIRRLCENWNAKQESLAEFYFPKPKYHLMERAIRLAAPVKQKAIGLRQASAHYWDRTHSVGDWWIELMVAIFLWIVGLIIFIAIFSLFLPLIQLVGGLTGTKF